MHPHDHQVSRDRRRLRVLIAPDSFKGSASAATVARSLAQGWRHERPDDDVVELPLADGGEGTLDAILSAVPGAREVVADPVPDALGRSTPARWVRLGDTALVELADSCGLQQIARPDADSARRAATDGLGALLRQVWADDVESVVVAIGGSASTDGGWGTLRALGLGAFDQTGRVVSGGGGALASIARLDVSQLNAPTPVLVLTDVTAPLLGPRGAARVFGPQKGADPDTVRMLECGLAHWAGLWAEHIAAASLAEVPGVGAAGGLGFGLAAGLGASLTSGAGWVAEQTGLDRAVATADVVITGEGSYDAQSHTGKLVGHVLGLSTSALRWVVAGRVESAVADGAVSLTELAGGAQSALADPQRWLFEAGRQVARLARLG